MRETLVLVYNQYHSGDSEQKENAKDTLWWFVRSQFKYEIPRVKIHEDHDAPFDFFCAVFFGLYKNIIAIANRNGGKTLIFAILDAVMSLAFDDCEIATLGAIEAQAKRCYGYLAGFNRNTPLMQSLVEVSLMSETRYKNGAIVQILTATMSGVNSPHPQKVFLDEVDLMDWVVLQEAFSMSASKGSIVGQNIITSTRKFVAGPMSKLVKQAKGKGDYKLFIWGIYESIEPHHISQTDGTALQEDLLPYYDKNGNYNSGGFYHVEDAISKKDNLDPDIWEAQWLCRRPESGGLMYPQFQNKVFAKGGNIYAHTYDNALETYVFEDFGFGKDHPNVNLFVQIDWNRKGLPRIYVFDEIYSEKSVSSDVVSRVADKWEDDFNVEVDYEKRDGFVTYGFHEFLDGWICDPAGLSEIEERNRMGCPIMDKADEAQLYRILTGASLLRVLFKKRQLLIHPRCVKLIEELESYSKRRMPDGTWSQDPQKKDDHGPDALRYGLIKLMPLEALEAIGRDDLIDEEQKIASRPITASLMKRKL